MFTFNKNFKDNDFLCSTFTVSNFLDKDNLNDLKNYIQKSKSFIQNGVTAGDPSINKTPPFVIYSNENNKNKNDARDSLICWVSKTNEKGIKNLYEKISKQIFELNEQHFQFILTNIEQLQYTIYKEGQYYKKHIDSDQKLCLGNTQRKLSFSIQLSSENDYEGGDLCVYNSTDPFVASKEKGSATFFNSLTLHEVTPVTKGTREALVGWVWGPRFK